MRTVVDYGHDNMGSGFMLFQFVGARAYGNNAVRYNITQNDSRNHDHGTIYLSGGAGLVTRCAATPCTSRRAATRESRRSSWQESAPETRFATTSKRQLRFRRAGGNLDVGFEQRHPPVQRKLFKQDRRRELRRGGFDLDGGVTNSIVQYNKHRRVAGLIAQGCSGTTSSKRPRTNCLPSFTFI
jgi:hypothetical protein